MHSNIFFSLFLVFFFSFSCAKAQLRDVGRYTTVGVKIGGTHYFGDLSPASSYFSGNLSFVRPAVGLSLQKRMGGRLWFGGTLSWARIFADDYQAAVGSFKYNRNLHFRNDLLELSMLVSWDILPSRGHYTKRRRWTPFVFGGLGILRHNPKAKTSYQSGNIWIPLQPLKTEQQDKKYTLWSRVIPIGLGVRLKVSEKIDLSLRSGFRFTSTDYLDDVSGVYPKFSDHPDHAFVGSFADRALEKQGAYSGGKRQLPDRAMQAGTPRGDHRTTDRYIITSVGISYILSKSKKADQLSRLHKINTPESEIKPKTQKNAFSQFKDRYKIANLAINSQYSEMSPKFYKGGLLYVSDRKDRKNFKKKSRGGFYNFFYSPVHDLFKNELTKPVYLKSREYLKYHHFAADYIEKKEKIILSLYESPDNSPEVKPRKLFVADVIGENVWENIRPLPFNENKSSVGQCSISEDGKTLYFVSDRPGGLGGTDIYVSYFYKNQWTYPKNLGAPINTEKNEMFPFIHQDSVLYFASDGHPGLGGLDIFEAVMHQKGKVKKIKNLGRPINSEKDDFGLILNQVKRQGYFTSNRSGGKGGNDIYELEILKIAASRHLTDEIDKLFKIKEMALKGTIVNKNTEQPIAKAIVKLYDKIADNLYLTRSDEFGRFTFKVHSDALYEIGSTVRGFKRMKNQTISTVGMHEKATFDYTLKMNPIEYKFKVKGRVIDAQTQRPLEGTEVVLLNLNQDQQEKIITKEDGTYAFSLEKDQNYVLFVLEQSYKDWKLNLSTLNKRASETKIIHIVLEAE